MSATPLHARPFASSLFRYAVAAAACAAGWAAVAALPVPDAAVREVVLRVLLLGWAGGLAVVFTRSWSEPARLDAAAGVTAVFVGWAFAYALHGAAWPPGGHVGDNAFKLAWVAQRAAGLGGDFFYRGLPSFYPPLYFDAVGWVARAAHLDPGAALQWGFVVSAAAVPLLTRALWAGAGDAPEIAALGLSALVYQFAEKPDAWLTLVVFVPFWVRWAEGGDRAAGRRAWLAAVLGAAVFSTYYYWFFVAGAAVGLRIVGRRVSPLPVRAYLGQVTVVLALTALIAAPYWVPLLRTFTADGLWRSYQNRWYLPAYADLPLPMWRPGLAGAVMLAGLGYLALRFRDDWRAFGLASLLVAAYAWFVAGYLFFLAGVPLMTFRTEALIEYTLVLAGCLAAAALLRQAWARWPAGLAGAVALTLALACGQGMLTGLTRSRLYTLAFAAPAPPPRIASFARAVGRGADGQVVLFGQADESLMQVVPVYAFAAYNEHYNHPASVFDRRIGLLAKLAREPDPRVAAAVWKYNRYDTPAFVLLPRGGEGFVFAYHADAFPLGIRTTEILLPAAAFAAPAFVALPVTDAAAFRFDAGAVTAPSAASLGARGLVRLVVVFGDDLDPAVRQALTREVAATPFVAETGWAFEEREGLRMLRDAAPSPAPPVVDACVLEPAPGGMGTDAVVAVRGGPSGYAPRMRFAGAALHGAVERPAVYAVEPRPGRRLMRYRLDFDAPGDLARTLVDPRGAAPEIAAVCAPESGNQTDRL